MIRQLLAIILAISILLTASTAYADVRVRGYFRKDGTYVAPHYRSDPDSSPYNNWSFPGNTNPYTGKVAPGNPDTYLDRYYNRTPGLYSTPKPLDLKPLWNYKGRSFNSYEDYRRAIKDDLEKTLAAQERGRKQKWLAEHKVGIRNLYSTILKREPYNESEVNYWANREGDINKIREEFYKSEEYQQLLAKEEAKTINFLSDDFEKMQNVLGKSTRKSWWQRFIEWLRG